MRAFSTYLDALLCLASLFAPCLIQPCPATVPRTEISAVRQMLASLQGTATGQLYAFSIASNMWTVMELGGLVFVMASAIDYPQVTP
jgi:hypothetical protein